MAACPLSCSLIAASGSSSTAMQGRVLSSRGGTTQGMGHLQGGKRWRPVPESLPRHPGNPAAKQACWRCAMPTRRWRSRPGPINAAVGLLVCEMMLICHPAACFDQLRMVSLLVAQHLHTCIVRCFARRWLPLLAARLSLSPGHYDIRSNATIMLMTCVSNDINQHIYRGAMAKPAFDLWAAHSDH